MLFFNILSLKFLFFQFLVDIRTFRITVLAYWLVIRTCNIFIWDFSQNWACTLIFSYLRIRKLSFYRKWTSFFAYAPFFLFFRTGVRSKLVEFVSKRHWRVSLINIIVNFLSVNFCSESNIIINIRNNCFSHDN